ncbi:MAG: hypothetical protein ABR568_01655 [Pyrinomonadaceae bacterium]
MFRTFDCPKCGAPVTYQRNDMPGARQATARCDYCHSSLIVPDELHGQPARVVPITIDLRSITRHKPTKWIWVLVAIPLFGLLLGVLAMVGVLAPVFYSISRTDKQPTKSSTTTATTNGFAEVVMKFGSEGIGPGMFKDARSIAVDGAGRIYVGEYLGGRIQVFDPSANFLLNGVLVIERPSCAVLLRIAKASFTWFTAETSIVTKAKPAICLGNWRMRNGPASRMSRSQPMAGWWLRRTETAMMLCGSIPMATLSELLARR